MRQLLFIAIVVGSWSQSALAQTCPPVIPPPPAPPADSFIVQCFTLGRTTEMRCGTPIPPESCDILNNRALSPPNGQAPLLTQDGYNLLVFNGFCAMTMDLGMGLQIYDFCPRGCFAADTQILTGIARDGKATYALAASVSQTSTVMSMTDDASLGDVVLAPQSIRRRVHGPEEPDLFVFALANGSTLRVTQHHPMVLDNGKIVQAAQVDARMSFVGLDGRSVGIAAITREKAVDEVYNFETTSETTLGHIIVAEGVLVGDLKLQIELENEEGSIGLRR